VAASDVAGISFDATCSLVVLGRNYEPLAVNEEGDDTRDVIVWMDHRALAEAEEINAGGHEVLRYVGGRISPEMETPKLLWLKRHLPKIYNAAGQFFDLADFLTWKASGSHARSACTVVCKWTYLGHENRWDRKYLEAIGLDDLLEGNRIGNDVRPIGSDLGTLSEESARELGLASTCRVGVGAIDAHAGGLGVLGALWSDAGEARDTAQLETALALIGGTSNCHMAVARDARFVPGVWGPYFDAMVPGMWLAEGGQSTAGSAIDYVIAGHAASAQLAKRAAEEGRTVYEILNALVEAAQSQGGRGPTITRDLHALPYFLGNRSPNADPHARAIFDGLRMDDSVEDLALRYYATLQAVAYGTRDIVRAMNESGFRIETIFATGGGTKNPLWLQEHADATGCRIVLAQEAKRFCSAAPCWPRPQPNLPDVASAMAA
jgi:D-ribulokinase